MADSVIALHLQQLDTEDLKNRLKEILVQLRAGKPVTSKLKTEVRKPEKQVRDSSGRRRRPLARGCHQVQPKTLTFAGCMPEGLH